MTTATYAVAGMTCGHCVSAVTAEVGKVPGVTAVDVDLSGETVTVSSEQAMDEQAVREAVEEAGYTLTGRSG
jgi:copper chaperone